MSRAASGDVIHLPPKSNVYTVLVATAILVEIVGLVALFMQAKALFGDRGLL